MPDKVVSDEEMERIGSLIPDMTSGQLNLVRNKIDQILFERAINGDPETFTKLVKGESAPGGMRAEMSKELEDLLTKSTSAMRKMREELGEITKGFQKRG